MKHNLTEIQDSVVFLSSSPLEPWLNFIVGVNYDNIGQTAAATGFYLRAAEYGQEEYPEIAYVALIKIASCMERQKDRNHTAKTSLLQAVALFPERPEAYFFLAQYYERQKAWLDCYTTAQIGSGFLDLPMKNSKLHEHLHNSGFRRYGCDFEKAVSGWWIGRKDESKDLFEYLLTLDIDPEYEAACNSNLERIK